MSTRADGPVAARRHPVRGDGRVLPGQRFVAHARRTGGIYRAGEYAAGVGEEVYTSYAMRRQTVAGHVYPHTRSGKEERGWSSGAVEGAVEGEL